MPCLLALQDEFSQPLMGEEIHLGLCNVVVIGPARFEQEAVPNPTLAPGHTRVRLIPLSGARAFLRRGPLLQQDAAPEDAEP
jgi:hypothetical protein